MLYMEGEKYKGLDVRTPERQVGLEDTGKLVANDKHLAEPSSIFLHQLDLGGTKCF